jgi:hypothetical protein
MLDAWINGMFTHTPPLIALLEVAAYCVLGVIKARQSMPHEGNIKGAALTTLERSGWKVESARIGDVSYNRDTVISKVAKLNSIVSQAVASGQYSIVKGKKEANLRGY